MVFQILSVENRFKEMAGKGQKLLEKYINDCYSKEDYLTLLERFKDDDQFEALALELEEAWKLEDGHKVLDEDYQRLWHQLKPEIMKRTKPKEKQKRYSINQLFNRVAAVLVLPLLLTSLYFFHEWRELSGGEQVFTEIHCPPGMRSQFNLPDGSTGWLNGDSHLKYPVLFTENRSVELDGEAYFDVKRDSHSPFVVNAGGVDIKVLGTHFNVMAYSDFHRVEVTLDEGAVQVSKRGTGLNEVLKPNEHFALDKREKRMSVRTVQTSYFTSWKEGVLEFRNVPLKEVALRLSRWYNSEITIQDEVLKDIPYRATFKNESLERVLSLLALAAPISYEIVEPKINEDGIYAKRQVILRYKN